MRQPDDETLGVHIGIEANDLGGRGMASAPNDHNKFNKPTEAKTPRGSIDHDSLKASHKC